MANTFSQNQLDSFDIIERVSATLSLTGTTLVIITFLGSKPFRTLSNTLIFYASFGNILSNVAHLIAIDGVNAGPNSALCQIQGFLQQMFMPADSLWSLAMAGNVYLAFFHHYDSESLKRLHWKYFLTCYGIPFIPAFIYLFVKNAEGARVYGGATLWCWVAKDWANLRIATYYCPIWFIMLCIFGIYIRVGHEVYKKRKELESVYQTANSEPHVTLSKVADTTPHNELIAEGPIRGTKTTEISVTSNIRGTGSNSAKAMKRNDSSSEEMEISDEYSVSVTSYQFKVSKSKSNAPPPQEAKKPIGLDRVMVAYTKCAALFAASLLITWIPSSTNRVYGLLYPTRNSYALYAASALVLPLQGFWNAVIYFVTSIEACRALWTSFIFHLRDFGLPNHFLMNSGSGKSETDSTVELSTELGVRHFDGEDSC